MPTLSMSSTSVVSTRSSLLPTPLQNTIKRIQWGLKSWFIELTRHRLAERALTPVRWYFLFKNGVVTTNEIVFPRLPKIWRNEVSRAGDLGLRLEDMKLPGSKELSRLVHLSAFDDVPYSNMKHSMVLTSHTSTGSTWSIFAPVPVEDSWNIMAFELMRVLMRQLSPC